MTGREGRKWRRCGVARNDSIPGYNQTSLLQPVQKQRPTYGVHAHISQLELLSLRRLRDSEMFSGCFCCPTPSAAILLLSDRLNTTNLLPGACFPNNRPSLNELIDQRKVRQILSSHSRWSFGWRQMVQRAGPAEIKILSMPLQISPGTKTKMKLGRFAMREQ